MFRAVKSKIIDSTLNIISKLIGILLLGLAKITLMTWAYFKLLPYFIIIKYIYCKIKAAVIAIKGYIWASAYYKISIYKAIFATIKLILSYTAYLVVGLVTKLSLIFTVDAFIFFTISVFVAYITLGFILFFYWGYLGLRGIFYLAESILLVLACSVVLCIYLNLRYHLAISCCIGEIYMTDDLVLYCTIMFDQLSLLGSFVVIILTAIVLTFGAEYMSREAFAYNVIIILIAFSASIVWFIISFDFGLMTIFWEFSGMFSILLVDTFYNRVRTTQAVSRTFTISRFSDYWMFLVMSELVSMFNTESLTTLFSIIRLINYEASSLAVYPIEVLFTSILAMSLLIAASCKCAQFILFVWLPDAMEAPTPASALIHSSTLVVMGIFMILRFAPIYRNCTVVLYTALLLGSITIVYGSVAATRTGDLKKAVAYSTISQVGYLYCGCGLLAFKETLIYLVVHAICKAMLFIFVGYIVHLFGGTTSLRKMGGIFYIVPDVAIYVMILCLILSGAPYTIGFIAKELIVSRLLSIYSPVMCVVIFCWVIGFLCTPIYLYRICILPLFGRPRASRKIFRNILLLKNKATHYSIKSFNLNILNNPLFFFMYHVRDLQISSRLTSIVHFIILVSIIYLGEFFILMVSGFFGSSDALFSGISSDISVFAVTNLYINSAQLVRNVQLLAVVLFLVVTLYFYIININVSSTGFKILNIIVKILIFLVLLCLLFNLIFLII